MHIKFLAHGTGSAARASAYLMGALDHHGLDRAGVSVLRGDPAVFAAVADSLTFQHRYTSAVISWAAEEAPTPSEIDAVLDDFEALAFAGLEPEDCCMTAVMHNEPDGGVHLHILIARVDLKTGLSFNPAPPGQRKQFDLVRDMHNHKHGWARPDDPLRARLLQPDFEAYKSDSDTTAIKKQVTEHLLGAAAQGLISNANELRAYLQESLGCEITRSGKNYVSIKPAEYPRAIRLKGELYGESWEAERTVQREAAREREAARDRGGRVDEEERGRAAERLQKAIRGRAKYNAARYRKEDDDRVRSYSVPVLGDRAVGGVVRERAQQRLPELLQAMESDGKQQRQGLLDERAVGHAHRGEGRHHGGGDPVNDEHRENADRGIETGRAGAGTRPPSAGGIGEKIGLLDTATQRLHRAIGGLAGLIERLVGAAQSIKPVQPIEPAQPQQDLAKTKVKRDKKQSRGYDLGM